MGIQGFVVAGIVIVLLAAVGYGMFSKRPSLRVGLAACILSVACGVLAWYAWAESKSVPWTIAYGVLLLISLASLARQFMRSRV